MGGRSLEGTRNDRNADDDNDGGGIPTRRMEEVGRGDENRGHNTTLIDTNPSNNPNRVRGNIIYTRGEGPPPPPSGRIVVGGELGGVLGHRSSRPDPSRTPSET